MYRLKSALSTSTIDAIKDLYSASKTTSQRCWNSVLQGMRRNQWSLSSSDYSNVCPRQKANKYKWIQQKPISLHRRKTRTKQFLFYDWQFVHLSDLIIFQIVILSYVNSSFCKVLHLFVSWFHRWLMSLSCVSTSSFAAVTWRPFISCVPLEFNDSRIFSRSSISQWIFCWYKNAKHSSKDTKHWSK